jgi:hypothetical protein
LISKFILNTIYIYIIKAILIYMAKRRSRKKGMNSNKYIPYAVLSAIILAFLVMVPITPTGDFKAAGKEYSSYVDYYDETPTSVDSDDFESCIKITKHDARWPKRNYYKVGSKKFKYGSKWRPTKRKTSAMRKAKKYASTEAASDGVDCWKYGKVVGIGKLGCMKVNKIKSRIMVNVYRPSGKSWKHLCRHQQYGKDWEIVYDLINSDSIANGNDVACVVNEWSGRGGMLTGLQINPDFSKDQPYCAK